VAVNKTDKNPQKAEQLKIFRARAMKDRIAFKWSTSDNLCLGIIKTLQTATETEPRSGWVRGDSIPSDAQISEVLKLREENERLKVLNKQVSAQQAFDPKVLDNKIRIKFDFKSTKGAEIKTKSCQVELNIGDVLRQFSFLEPLDESTLRLAIRGAISKVTGKDYENIEIALWDIDLILIEMLNSKILNAVEGGNGIHVKAGINFIKAHVFAKRKAFQ
jgi:hypothetical protein